MTPPSAATLLPVLPVFEGLPVLLYDGSCGLCHASVRFVLRRERYPCVLFAALDSETAVALRAAHPTIPATSDTVVLVTPTKVHLRSRAFFHLARDLRAPWRWMSVFRVLPAFLTDLPYRLVAALRYRIWGRADACSLPSPDERARFLP